MSGVRKVRDFQKVDPYLRDHPSFKKFCRALQVQPALAHGLLCGVWAFAFKFAHDGDLSRFDAEDLAEAAGYDGDPQAMVAALRKAGFTDLSGYLSDWSNWGGALFDGRRKDAERKYDDYHSKQGNLSMEEGTSPRRKQEDVPEEKRRDKRIEQVVVTKNVTPTYSTAFAQFWEVYGRKGNKNDSFTKWLRWLKAGAQPEDLIAAATNYRASDPRFPQYQLDGSTFLATKNKEGDPVNRWEEWVKPEAKPNGNGKPPRPERQAAPGHEWQCSRDPWSGKDEWLEVPCST